MTIAKLAHVVWECKYHIVFVSKYRYKFFSKKIKEAVRDELMKLCVWIRINTIEGNVCKDHVHMCISIPSKLAKSEVVGTLKGKTALRMFKKFPEIRKQYRGSHFWSRGYFVSAAGRDEEIIRQYI